MFQPAALFVIVMISANYNLPTGAEEIKSLCNGAFKTKLTQEQIDQTVNAHNNVRSKDGADQVKMTWDNDLASLAQEWADYCRPGHNIMNDCKGNRVGQNAYGSTGMDLNMAAVVDRWASEKADYDLASMSCNAGKVCGHWTQVVWSRSTKVGCGYKTCDDGSTVVICDYSPPGNYGGQLPYIKGASCSACKRESDALPGFKCVDGLCGPSCSPTTDADCKCGTCQNGGTPNAKTCLCDCPKGKYFGPYCTEQCGKSGQVSDDTCQLFAQGEYCLKPDYYTYVAQHCSQFCPYCAA